MGKLLKCKECGADFIFPWEDSSRAYDNMTDEEIYELVEKANGFHCRKCDRIHMKETDVILEYMLNKCNKRTILSECETWKSR